MHGGYFTRHNVRFKPSPRHPEFDKKQDSVGSDIDIIGFNPRKTGRDRVKIVSCKAWQHGFDPAAKVDEILHNKKAGGREAWRGFRELVKPKWSEAFMAKIEAVTGTREFTYLTVVTWLRNAARRSVWEENQEFRQSIGGNPIKILTLAEILEELSDDLTTTPAASDIGRALQLMKASGWQPNWDRKQKPKRGKKSETRTDHADVAQRATVSNQASPDDLATASPA